MISGGFRTPTRRPFRANRVNEEQHESLPPELEARLAALEAAASDEDFDPMSWFWMGLFGVVLPAALIVLGM
jgi:hypothetical protein